MSRTFKLTGIFCGSLLQASVIVTPDATALFAAPGEAVILSGRVTSTEPILLYPAASTYSYGGPVLPVGVALTFPARPFSLPPISTYNGPILSFTVAPQVPPQAPMKLANLTLTFWDGLNANSAVYPNGFDVALTVTGTPVPDPSSITLVLLGACGLLAVRRSRNQERLRNPCCAIAASPFQPGS